MPNRILDRRQTMLGLAAGAFGLAAPFASRRAAAPQLHAATLLARFGNSIAYVDGYVALSAGH